MATFSLLAESLIDININVRNALQASFIIIMAILAIAMIILVLLQKTTGDNNLGAISGNTETYMGKNKTRTVESKLKIATGIVAALLVIFSILYLIFQI